LGCSDGGGLERCDLRQLSGVVLPHYATSAGKP
jgi:hypothetical protein